MSTGDRRLVWLVYGLSLAAHGCSGERSVDQQSADGARHVHDGSQPSAADTELLPDDSVTGANGAATVARRPGGTLPTTNDPGDSADDPASGGAGSRAQRPLPVASPPVLIGTLVGPGMKRAQPDLHFYGTDLGTTFEHDGKLFMLFGDTWTNENSVCEDSDPMNDDVIGTLPLEYDGAFPEVRIIARDDDPNQVSFVHLYRGDESLRLGTLKAPITGFSDGNRSFALFERMQPHPCDAGVAVSMPCPTDDGFQCSTTLGICDPAMWTIPIVCELGSGRGCFPNQECKPVSMCVDPSNSQFGDGRYAGQERSIAHTLELGVARKDNPVVFDSAVSFPTTKFSIPASRTVTKFTGKQDGNDYLPGNDRVLIWGRPGLTSEYERDAHLYLMTHRLPLPLDDKGKLSFEPDYFAGIDAQTGEPTWSKRQSEAKAIALDGVPGGDPYESVQILMNTTVSWLPAPINKWMMMYGGDLADYLMLDADASRSARTPGAIWMRFADHPWGPFSPATPHLAPGSPLRVNDPSGPGGYLYNLACTDVGTQRCAASDPRRPTDAAIPGCPFSIYDPGKLYAPNVIDRYTKPNANGGLDVVWNVSTFNPYGVRVMQTTISPPGSAARPLDEVADAKALQRLSHWRSLPELSNPHRYLQQTSYDRGTRDSTFPLSGRGNRDFNNFVCASDNAQIGASQLTPLKYDLEKCPESYVRGVVLSRFEGAGHMVRMWLGMQSLMAAPADDEVLRIYVDDDPRPKIDVPLAEAFDGRAGEIFAPPFGAGSPTRMAWYYPVSYRKKLIVALDRLGENDTYFYHCDVVPDAPSAEAIPTERLPEREDAQQQLARMYHPSGTHALLYDPLDISLQRGETQQVQISGPGTIYEFRVRAPENDLAMLGRVHVQVRWDGATDPAIDVSLADLLGGSVAPERSSLALTSIVDGGDHILSLKLPMPFRTEAALSFENTGRTAVGFGLRLIGDKAVTKSEFGHLSVTRTETVGPTTAAERVALSATGRGRLVGMCTEVQGHADSAAGIQYDQLNLLEGDVRAKIDGELALNGTGSEETADDVFYFLNAPYGNAFAQVWGVQNDRMRPPGRASFCSWYVLGRELDFQKSLELTFELGGAGNPTIVERHKSVSYMYLADSDSN